MPKMPPKPKLVNRGPAGLLAKKPSTPAQVKPEAKDTKSILETGTKDHFLPELEGLCVPIEEPIPDPLNARLHPERNMEAIMLSLARYGQRTPIVINKRTGHVLKGNGTLQAAKNLEWTKIAAVFADDEPHEAAGYSLADNRSGELAKWDFEMVSLLDKLMQEAGEGQIGWTLDELEVLRNADWAPPTIANGEGDEEGGYSPEAPGTLVLKFSDEMKDIVQAAIDEQRARLVDGGEKKEPTDCECLAAICKEWMGGENA